MFFFLVAVLLDNVISFVNVFPSLVVAFPKESAKYEKQHDLMALTRRREIQNEIEGADQES